MKHTLVYSQAVQTQWEFVGTLNLQEKIVIIAITISLTIKMFLYNIKIKNIKESKILTIA